MILFGLNETGDIFMHKRPWLAIALLVGLGLFLIPMTASAYFFTYGEAAIETGDIPDELGGIPELNGMKAGYKCDMLAVLWAYVYLDGCEPVIYKELDMLEFEYIDGSVIDGLNDLLEEEYSEDDMKMNAWQAHGKWVLALLLILIIGVKFMGGNDEEEVPDMSALDTGGGDDGGAFSFNDGDAPADDGGGGDDSPLT
jgi:hypothetical protein